MAGEWETFEGLTKNRNFLSLLAGMGSTLGAGGVGEAIGVPTQQNIQSMAMQEAAAKAEGERGKWNKALMDLLSGGLTPKDQPGPTSVKVNPDNLTLDISTVKTPATAEAGATGTQARGIAPSGQLGTPKLNLTDILGFWQTPSR